MTKFLRVAALAAAMAASCAAHATSYVFSYTFASGDQVTGSFDGTDDGSLITGLSNISVSLNGVAFAGNGNLLQFRPTDAALVYGEAQVSFSGTENRFLFATASPEGYGDPGDGIFVIVNRSDGYNVAQATILLTAGVGESTDYSAARWSVTAVPEPATYGMLLGGLGVVGALARRRGAAAALA